MVQERDMVVFGDVGYKSLLLDWNVVPLAPALVLVMAVGLGSLGRPILGFLHKHDFGQSAAHYSVLQPCDWTCFRHYGSIGRIDVEVNSGLRFQVPLLCSGTLSDTSPYP